MKGADFINYVGSALFLFFWKAYWTTRHQPKPRKKNSKIEYINFWARSGPEPLFASLIISFLICFGHRIRFVYMERWQLPLTSNYHNQVEVVAGFIISLLYSYNYKLLDLLWPLTSFSFFFFLRVCMEMIAASLNYDNWVDVVATAGVSSGARSRGAHLVAGPSIQARYRTHVRLNYSHEQNKKSV